MRSIRAKYALVVLVAAAAYYVLTFFMIMQVFGNVPGLEWMQDTFGRLAGARIWAHSVHALALLVAGIPSALLSSLTCRPRAVVVAAIAGTLTAAAGLSPNFLFHSGTLYGFPIFHIIIDSMMFVVILMLLTWIATKLPSNNAMQRSALVVTPLATNARGAPTARRR